MKRQALYNARMKLGITQEHIAEQIGINRSHYGFIENGQRNPSYIVAYRISRFFKIPIQELFSDIIFFGDRCYTKKQLKKLDTKAV